MKSRLLQKMIGRLAQSLLLVLYGGAAVAGVTDISNVPMIGSNSVTIKPNIMLVLDTSNSMSWTHMPDTVEIPGVKQSMGYKTSQCNSIYYDPTKTYVLPRDSANAALPTPSFTAAPYNYYSSDTSTVNLSNAFQAHDSATVQNLVTSLPDAAQQAYYFVLTPNTPANMAVAQSLYCNLNDSTAINTTATGNVFFNYGTWKRVLVNATSGVGGTDERVNFAIWYTYYRTRIALSKSSIGRAFAPLSDNYRVGMVTVNPTIKLSGTTVTPTDTVQANHYTAIGDFDSTQRTLWYSNFYGQTTAGSSPAREALARVGRHYAGKTDGINKGMSQDPVQYACQPNFAIMTTDGYWNVAAEKASPGGGPTNIAGTAWVGQQDNPATLDNGLVPIGVFDGTATQLAYTVTGTSSVQTGYGTCPYTVAGYNTTRIKKTATPWVKKVVTVPNLSGSQRQTRLVTMQQRTYTVVKEVLQYWKSATTSQRITSSYTWKNPVTELNEPVISCTGLSNCVANSVTDSVALGSCVQQDPVAPYYVRVQCNGVAALLQSSACTVGVAGCYTVTITAPTLVPANTCNYNANNPPSYMGTNPSSSGSPNYQFTNCTPSISSAVYVSQLCNASFSAAANVTCAYVSATGWTNTDLCTAGWVDPAPTYRECKSVPVCVGTCTTSTVYSHSDTDACVATPQTVVDSNLVTTTCQIGEATLYPAVVTPAVDPASCPIGTAAPSAANNYNQVTCAATTNLIAGACVPHGATAPDWAAVSCANTTVAGWNTNTQETLYKYFDYHNGLPPVAQTPVVNPVLAGPTGCNAPPTPALQAPTVTPLPPHSVEGSSGGGSSNSLADVAQYYYATDLRPDMPDIVRPTAVGVLDDRVGWQHMTTFVVGLGVSGTLAYKPDYLTSATGSFAAIRAATANWPVWPDPTINYTGNDAAYSAPRSIDDFWHAAVNGRGKYFSATDPDSVVAGINGALTAISATAAAGSSLSISDQIGRTINGLYYVSDYTTVSWVGDVRAKPSSDITTTFWSAQAKLQTQVQADCDDRKIYVRTSSGTSHLQEFTAGTKKCSTGAVTSDLSSTLLANFSATSLTQYAGMTTGASGTVNQRAQATAASLVNYIRGQSQNEGYVSGTTGKLYRSRLRVLGDIVGSKPQYVAAPYRDYLDAGYAAFRSTQANRVPMVYVGANDGMLHAFNAPNSDVTGTTLSNAGTEAWAYIPTKVISNLSRLADTNYSSNHQYSVDGTPLTADVKFSNGEWHTILVGGLNGGGNGYYALDITNPTSPVSLWEFDSSNCSPSGCSVGLSFGVPVIGKMADGTWAVFLTSGYNNSTGQATLFILNAQTGASIKSMNAGSGSASDPMGLAKISAWINYPGVDDTVQNVYGGDLKGNIWRFDINSAASTAVLLGVARDRLGVRQPITTAPEIGIVNGRRYVYVGTGRLLGISDLNDTQQQSVYGFYDSLVADDNTTALRSVFKVLRTKSDYTMECSPDSVVSCEGVNDKGFAIDLVGTQEQIILPLTLIGSTLTIVSNQPQSGACGSGTKSSVYFAMGDEGGTVSAGLALPNGAVGVTYVNGAEQTVIGYPRTDPYSAPGVGSFAVPTGMSSISGASRASWRGILQQ